MDLWSNSDIVLYGIMPFLSDRSRLNLIIICRDMMEKYLRDIYFDQQYPISCLSKNMWYFHSIRNVYVSGTDAEIFPKSMTQLEMRYYYFREYMSMKLPPTLTHLTITGTYYQQQESKPPWGITHLIFNGDFVGNLRDVIPESVRYLTFNHNSSSEILEMVGMIPSTVTHLTFGPRFDQDIRGALPDKLISLTLGAVFKHSLNRALPWSLTQLIINGKSVTIDPTYFL